MTLRLFLIVSALTAGSAVLVAAPVPNPLPPRPKSDPPDVPLTLEIAGQLKYPVPTEDRTTRQYRTKVWNELRDIVKKTDRDLPPVDIKLIVRNTGKEPLTVRHLVQDDDVRPRFTLTGKGAVILDRSDPESMKGLEGLILHEKLGILRSTRGTDLQPGDQASEKYASLACGDRLMSRCCYWTAAGNYQLTAELTVLVSPPPKGSKESGGYGIVRLTSVPVTISVSSEK